MKAIISDRIYLNVDADFAAKLRSQLIYSIPVYIAGKTKHTKLIMTKTVSKTIMSIPAGRTDLIPSNYEIVDKRVDTAAYFPNYVKEITLRESQQEIFDTVDSSCIINAPPSWGKTFTGLAIAKKLGLKTLIVTHTVFLRDQWQNQVESLFGFTPSIIGSGKFTHDKCITLANVQTLVKHYDKIKKEFGTLIVDEAHHTPSSTFLKIVESSHAKYKIGLSGTLERKDGYHVIMKDVFSPTIFQPKAENRMIPKVCVVKPNISFNDDNSIPWAFRVNQLMENKDYMNLLLGLVQGQVDRGHKVLVVSDRNDILKYCQEIMSDNSICVTGETPTEVRNELEGMLLREEIDVIFGGIRIFSEGISINCLSSVVCATPINNDSLLTQLIGRICRLEEGKREPEVIDINLLGRIGKNQAKNRLALYINSGFPVVELNVRT
jgi:superfamily II DNA or RNA helicase